MIAAACSCSVAFGWGGDGHEITALIAAQHLTEKARLLVFKSFKTPSNTYSPSAEMKFLIHLVGDVHQPLHAATNADAGGNCVNTSGFHQRELHAVWDTGMVLVLRGDAGNPRSNADIASALEGIPVAF